VAATLLIGVWPIVPHSTARARPPLVDWSLVYTCIPAATLEGMRAIQHNRPERAHWRFSWAVALGRNPSCRSVRIAAEQPNFDDMIAAASYMGAGACRRVAAAAKHKHVGSRRES